MVRGSAHAGWSAQLRPFGITGGMEQGGPLVLPFNLLMVAVAAALSSIQTGAVVSPDVIAAQPPGVPPDD